MKKIKNKKQYFLIMGAIVLPLAGLVCWLVSGAMKATVTTESTNGLNMKLPAAVNGTDSGQDKFSFYLSAQADSAKRKEQARNDPYLQDTVVREIPAYTVAPVKRYTPARNDVQERMEEIQRKYKTNEAPAVTPPVAKPVSVDPDIAALNETLEKLASIQRPEKVKLSSASESKGFHVEAVDGEEPSFFGKTVSANGRFYGDRTQIDFSHTILARIAVTQVVQSGSLVKLELLSSLSVNGNKIAAGSSVYGIASLQGERLHIQISSVVVGKGFLPVSLLVYDLDGIEGIHVRGSELRDAVTGAGEQLVQSTDINAGFDLKSKVASAGINAAKGLFSKKVKAAPVTLDASYQVLLIDKNQK